MLEENEIQAVPVSQTAQLQQIQCPKARIQEMNDIQHRVKHVAMVILKLWQQTNMFRAALNDLNLNVCEHLTTTRTGHT